MRVVFDTNTLISALLFRGETAWLIRHWQGGQIVPLASQETASELLRVLAYPKFGLTPSQIDVVAGRFLPFVERIQLSSESPSPVQCRDPKDQVFLELGFQGNTDVLVSGDNDLLALSGTVPFSIEPPAAYKQRVASLGFIV